MSGNCIENIIFEKSLNAEQSIEHSKFKSRQWSWIPDNNNNNYASGQLIFDCSTFASTSNYCWYQDAYFLIPVVISSYCAAADVDGATGQQGMTNAARYLHALKSGYWNLFNSFTITQNNVTIHQNIPFSNMYISYKMMSEMSDEELKKYGKMLGMCKDNGMSGLCQVSSSNDGIGMCNNTNCYGADNMQSGSVPYSDLGIGWNQGMRTRQTWTNNTALGNASTKSAQNTVAVSTDADKKTCVSYVLATIRLKDISTYFASLPLIKGAKLNFIINCNQGKATIDIRNGLDTPIVRSMNTTLDLTSSNISMIGGATTFPAMIASTCGSYLINGSTFDNRLYLTSGGGAIDLDLNAGMSSTIELAVNFCKATVNGTTYTHPTITQCRLYVPMFEFTSEAEKEYLDAGISKSFAYNELFSYQQFNVPAQNVFNVNITSGIANAREMVVMPLMASTTSVTHFNYTVDAAGVYTVTDTVGALGYNSLLSPFATAPATLDLQYGGITDYNVQFGGSNIYSQNVQYGFQNYMMETKNLGLNGGYIRGITSGQIAFEDWESMYGYYVTDLSNRSSQEQGMSKSISLLGTNSNTFPIDLYVFVAYEKRVSVNVVTGDITFNG